ncbi:MAG: hypothetical protein KAR87_01110 [Candidatus Aenigmarchaeota archaeon]|nr:hypothetical protein [Candidatus Aenigmarchaeota archaeon]
MVQTHHGFRHLHQRMNEYEPDKLKMSIDKVIYPLVLIGPLMTLPQILKIYTQQTASGLSLLSWSLFMIPAFAWILYGFAHKEKVIILCNMAWIIVYIFVIGGIFLYG